MSVTQLQCERGQFDLAVYIIKTEKNIAKKVYPAILELIFSCSQWWNWRIPSGCFPTAEFTDRSRNSSHWPNRLTTCSQKPNQHWSAGGWGCLKLDTEIYLVKLGLLAFNGLSIKSWSYSLSWGAAGRERQAASISTWRHRIRERDRDSQGTRGHYASPVVFYLFTLYGSWLKSPPPP